jgi:hypothetical protein
MRFDVSIAGEINLDLILYGIPAPRSKNKNGAPGIGAPLSCRSERLVS